MVQKHPPSPDAPGYDYSRLHKFRDRHAGGIGWEMGKLTNERQARLRLRSKPDIKFFKMLGEEPMRIEAYLKIQVAHQIMNAGLGVKVQNFEGIGGKGLGDIEHGAVLLAHYSAWKELCKVRYISALMAEDMIILNMSLRDSDATRRMMTGTAKKNLLACLDAWFEVKG